MKRFLQFKYLNTADPSDPSNYLRQLQIIILGRAQRIQWAWPIVRLCR